MYWFQKIKLSFLFLLAIIASGLFVVHTAKAYEYNLWASRKYYDGTNAYIVGTGDNPGYERDYFTGLWYCTWYYYVNHNADIHVANHENISTARQVFDYDESNIIFVWDYINSKLISTSTAWSVVDYGILGNDFRFDITRLDTNAPFIPKVYTLGRFWIINTNIISDTTVSLKYLNPKSLSWSTYIDHTSSTFDWDTDENYSFNIKYYAQPCVPDMPTTSTDRALINGADWNDAATRLARIPAIHGLSTNLNSWRPVTLGSSDFTNTSNFIPANINLNTTFDQDVTFDDWIYFAGIKEPDLSSVTAAFSQDYWYNAWGARGSWFVALDANFVARTTTNQWWINPDTVNVTVEFIWVDKTNFGDAGTSCTVVITGDALWLSGLGHSWNRNQLWYEVNITSGVIRLLAKTQCNAAFSSVLEENIDLKRETVANISWDAYDFSNSMIISQDNNTVTYATPNRIVGTTGYIFNSYSADPILSMSTDSINLINWTTIYNVPVENSQLLFTGTDVYAWVNSGTFLVVVSGYNSSIDKSDSRITSGTPDYTYTFSGTDITKYGFDEEHWRFDYTGFVDFATNWAVETGMHFTVHFEVEDFVWNKKIQNYVFRTPTYPNAPHWGPESTIAQTNQSINQINIIDDIDQDTQANNDGSDDYNYITYYPSSSDLITDFGYISGASVLTANTDLVLYAENGNNGGATTVTMTWLIFNYDWSGSYVSWTPHVSSGWVTMTDYLDTTFTFEILATNIYGITWVITYNITVAPSCSESPGCTDPVYVFWGTDLAIAQAQRTAALASGTDYMKSNHWYPHWFAEIKQTWPNFYFTGVSWEPDAKVLYCASTGNNLLINYNGYTWPQSNVLSNPTSPTFSWADLNISANDAMLFNVFTASISADYITENVNWTDKMTIYVNRPLTGRVFYSECELTGWSLDAFGCPENLGHNRTWDINWTKLTDADVFTMTWWIEGWWITGSESTYWSTGIVSNGWWTRQYTKNITGDLQEDINTNWAIFIDIENRTWSTSTVNHEVYWIDNTVVSMTWIVTVIANQSATVTLSGYNTGQLLNSNVANLIWDDEYIVTKFSGDVEPSLFESGYGSTIHTWDFYTNWVWSGYSMIHNIDFAQDRVWEICVEDRAGNASCMFIEVVWIGTMKELIITVRPAFRPEPVTNDTWYSIVDWDFWFWIKSGSIWTQNYNSARNGDSKITTNKNGTGIVYIMTPSTGAEYLVTFKWSGTLSAWFTGIWSNSITELNFFSGAYANTLHNDYVYKYNNWTYIENYLKVWDIIADGTWTYDYIKDPDFAEINNNLTIGTNIIPEYRYDFDINDVISSMEQSMILQAWDSHWFIGSLDFADIIPMTGFVDL